MYIYWAVMRTKTRMHSTVRQYINQHTIILHGTYFTKEMLIILAIY